MTSFDLENVDQSYEIYTRKSSYASLPPSLVFLALLGADIGGGGGGGAIGVICPPPGRVILRPSPARVLIKKCRFGLILKIWYLICTLNDYVVSGPISCSIILHK